eukprot:3996448-Amphidinium_carterae.1
MGDHVNHLRGREHHEKRAFIVPQNVNSKLNKILLLQYLSNYSDYEVNMCCAREMQEEVSDSCPSLLSVVVSSYCKASSPTIAEHILGHCVAHTEIMLLLFHEDMRLS